MNLIIDSGNTFTKIAIFENQNIVHVESFSELNIAVINNIETKFKKITHSIYSTVSEYNDEVVNYLQNSKFHINFSHKTKIPFINTYKTPETIGLDRLAGIAGAQDLFPDCNCLVIDAGTAITYDVITSDSRYLGGNISPGMSMRFKALNNFTKRLPLCSVNEDVSFLGVDTNSAIESGVQNGILLEIAGYISTLEKEFPDLKIILTGGDTIYFDKKLKNTIFAEPFLILKGLNRILKYNVG